MTLSPLPYAAVLRLVPRDLVFPCVALGPPGTLVCYVPAEANAAQVSAYRQRQAALWPGVDVQVCPVTGIPPDRWRPDWREHPQPKETV